MPPKVVNVSKSKPWQSLSIDFRVIITPEDRELLEKTEQGRVLLSRVDTESGNLRENMGPLCKEVNDFLQRERSKREKEKSPRKEIG